MTPALTDELLRLVPLSAEPSWAAHVPLVHFPAGATFVGNAERAGVSDWQCLASPRHLGGVPGGGSRYARELAAHVFFFAGVAAFTKPGAEGDCALYVRPAAEVGAKGKATPFDSGALLRPTSTALEPWCTLATDRAGREQACDAMSVDVVAWRSTFARWLACCYAEPLGYLDTRNGRANGGRPDRTVPPELPSSAIDRRAWTWEVRIEGRVALEHVGVVHVPKASFRRALEWKKARGLDVTIRSYESEDVIPSPDALFDASEGIVRGHFLP